jgi:hypothetical protein
VDLLSHVHGISRLRAASIADSLVERLLLVEEGTDFAVAHPIIAEVVSGRLSVVRRREIHRAIAVVLHEITGVESAGDVAGEIARHAELGGKPDLAYRCALAASDGAVQRFAFDEALAWLDLASSSAGSAGESDDVDRRTADVLRLAGWEKPPEALSRPGSRPRVIRKSDVDLRPVEE